MANFCRKFNVLIWKSYVVRKCHWFITLLELCVPVVLFIGLVAAQNCISEIVKPVPEMVYSSESEKSVKQKMNEAHIIYAPTNDVTNKLMLMVKDSLKDNYITIHNATHEDHLELVYKQLAKNFTDYRSVFGIVFEGDLMKPPLKKLNYKIRSRFFQDTTDLYSGVWRAATADLYISEGFLGFQMTLDRCFMKLIGKESKAAFQVQRFPLPAMEESTARIAVLDLLSLATVLSFIFLCPGVLKRVVEEKQSGVKELMKLMGLPSLLLWLSWFIHAMSVAIISVTAIAIIASVPFSGVPLMLCNGFVVWIFLALYCTAAVSFLFAISAMFKRPTLAMVFGLIAWIGSAIATKFVVGRTVSPCCKWLSALLPNVALDWGYHAIKRYEIRDISMSLMDVFNPTIAVADGFQLGNVWLMFVVQAVLYFFIALYLEAIFPGDYGVAKPWYFPFMECIKWAKVSPQDDFKLGDGQEGETFEPLADTQPIGIKIRDLRKVFHSAWRKEDRVAVDGVSLDICKEQITALLGHNGAGKSTTMMILTGMLSPTSGTVVINGMDSRRHMSKIRESLGLCPQHNLLFPDLTVRQHLVFFARLKGDPENDPLAEVDLYATKLNLISYYDKKPHELSGGYKRRLCLALAFIGRSKTVILDEPTSGLDPEARREIWDLLLSMRGERTILITTHIMEEADVLGDRIAIMDHGQVQCYGTPMYLKKIYGTGYVLSILKKNSSDPMKIEEEVRNIIPQAELKSSIASLTTFRLPHDQTELFPALFSTLQEKRVELGVESVGVSITTLEEVFLRVGEIVLEEAGKNEDGISEMSEKSECSSQPFSHGSFKCLRGSRLLLQQLEALFIKRALVMTLSYVFQLVLSVLVVILVTTLSLRAFGGNPVPSFKLDLSLYGKTNVLYNKMDDTPGQLTAYYKAGVEQAGSNAVSVSSEMNMTAALLQKGYEDKENYLFKYIAAGTLNNSAGMLTALYSDLALHSLPISMNLLTNALIKYETQDSDYGISVTNHPFQIDQPEFLENELVVLLWMALVPLALSFWVGLFVVLPMQERVSASRQLQCMAGVKVPVYWFNLYLWDLMLHTVLTSILVLTVMIFDHLGVYENTPEITTLFLILFLFGMSAIPFSYLISFMKDTWAGCYSIVVIVNIVAGLIMSIVMQIVHGFDVKSADGIEAVVRLIPNFAFTQVIQNFIMQVMNQKICLRTSALQLKHMCNTLMFERNNYEKCCTCTKGECSSTNISYIKANSDLLLYLGLTSILYLAIVLVVDMGLLEWLWEKLVAQVTKDSQKSTGNDDVDGEAKSVKKNFDSDVGKTGSSDLLVNDLKKKYGVLPNPMAVKGVSFHVKPGECFGLLGVNGAGKTTTFKMLTGAVVPTHGVAAISGYRSDMHKSQYLSQIGYCPQHDALIECLTASKALWLYGALRGVPKDKLDHEVNRWINMMGLREYRDKACGTYSGGNKRKLMTAMALIGNPPLVFLDEPTSGVDPVARRNLWNSLIHLQKAGQSIVLTSHSMEECEALCNRLGIMVAGQLVCVGSIPYLKDRYRQGSTIKIKLKPGEGEGAVNAIKEKVIRAFPNITLKDAHETLLHYQATDPELSWGDLFKKMEDLKRECEILEDYTISETTLEEVFLSFAQS